MYKDKRILAVIPARKGSKGIHNKNIIPIAGKPLMAFAIESAKKSKYIDEVCVSSDSNKFLDIASKWQVTPIKRPASISKDGTQTYEALQHALKFSEKNKEKFDLIIQLQPTSPLRTAKDIDQAIRDLCENDNEMLLSLTKAPFPPELLLKITGKKANFLSTKYFKNVCRQKLPNYYMPNGAIYIYKRSIIQKAKSYPYIKNKTGYYLMPKSKSIDIDEPFELAFASLMLKNNLHKG